jgi:hypothetical protein
MWRLLAGACALLSVTGTLLGWAPAPPNLSCTVRGQVVFAGDRLPANPDVKVVRDRQSCLAKGPIKQNALVVHPKNRGVRWVLVWLAPLKDFRNPQHVPPCSPPPRKVVEKRQVTLSCCAYEPRVVALREGTPLVFKNADSIAHAVRVSAGEQHFAWLIPPGKEHAAADLKARFLPGSFECPIHSWMRGWIGVFKHPYFAVTDADGKFEIPDAPPGRWRLILWQEKVGWVVREGHDVGKIIDVRKGRHTTHRILLEPPRD